MQVPKVTRQVIRMSASDAVKAGYVRGNVGWRGAGGVSNSSWAAAGGETRREPSGSSTWDKAASQTLRTGTESSEANGSESNMSSVQTMTAAAGNGGGIIMQPAVDDGVVLTDKNNIALDPYVPGMMLRTKPRPPGIKVLQHVPVASPQQNTQQYHRHDTGLRVSGSGGGGVESSSSQGTPARVIQPVRVHARPPQLQESPVRDMKQVEDSLSSLLSGLGSGRGMGPPSPVKKGIHTLEKTLQGVHSALQVPSSGHASSHTSIGGEGSSASRHSRAESLFSLDPATRWKAASNIQAVLRMGLLQRKLWDQAVFKLEDLMSRRAHVAAGPRTAAAAQEGVSLSIGIMGAERTLVHGLLGRRLPPLCFASRSLSAHPLFHTRVLASRVVTAAAKRKARQNAYKLFKEGVATRREAASASVQMSHQQQYQYQRQMMMQQQQQQQQQAHHMQYQNLVPRQQHNPLGGQAGGSMGTPTNALPRPSRRPPSSPQAGYGSHAAPPLRGESPAAPPLRGESPSAQHRGSSPSLAPGRQPPSPGRMGGTPDRMKYPGGNGQQVMMPIGDDHMQRYGSGGGRPRPQRSLLGALSQPAGSQSPMQHTQMMTRSPTPNSPEKSITGVPGRRASGEWGAGSEEDMNMMEASMLEMAGAHIASGLLEDNAGSARVWEEQEV